MRYLHPVGISERLIASGVYIRIEDGNIQNGWVEEWAIHQLPDQSRLIRIDMDERASTGRSVLTEAWASPPADGGQIARIDFLAYGGKEDPIKQVRATHSFFEDHVEIGRSLDKQPRLYDERLVPEEYIGSGRAMVLLGLAVAGLVEQGDRGVVVMNRVDFSTEKAFSVQVNNFVASRKPEQVVEHNGRSMMASRYTYEVDGSVAAPIWLDEYAVPLRIDKPDGQTIFLRDYVRAR